MTGEQTLRALAEHRRRMIAAVPSGQRKEPMLSTRSFLTGAAMALVGAGVLDWATSSRLLEELLAPIEQPLVDSGVIDRARISTKVEEIVQILSSFRPKDEH
jgi:hypothetical protein